MKPTRMITVGTLQSDMEKLPTSDQYEYDRWNRLSKVTKEDGTVVTYKYNGDNLMVERTENGATSRYYYAGSNIIAEGRVHPDGSVTKIASYIRGLGLNHQTDVSGNKAYYVVNGKGDVEYLLDSTGSVQNSYTYDIWGTPEEKNETIHNPFLYSGEYWDDTTALQYLRARWYDPGMGRFINEDSYEGQLDNPLSLNYYTYVYNNPLIYHDPDGNIPLLIVTGAIGVVAGGITGGIYSYVKHGEVRWKDVAAGALIGGAIGVTGGAGAAYFTTGSITASTGAVAAETAAIWGSAGAITIKGIDSVWKLNPIERGRQIEERLGGWNNNFPVIDKAGSTVNGVRTSITSIKSLDLGAKSYQTGNAVYSTVMGYTRSLVNFTSTLSNGIRVNVNSSTQRILELAIPKGASSAQMTQINNAVAEAAKQGVQIVIKIFN